jgi:hypothetical protein
VGIDDFAGGRRGAMNDNRSDAVSFDDHRAFRVELSVADIDDGRVGDRECLRSRANTHEEERKG